MRILIIEDSERLRRSLRTGLAALGHEVDAAADGAAGLDRIAERRPDVVLLDVMMPGVDGLEVLRRLRARADRVPVLVLSARDTVEQRVAGLRAGADDYLVKPFEFEELCARIEALVRRSDTSAPATASGERTADGPGLGVDGLEGSVLDRRYLLHEPLGRGGFAVVYRARHLELSRWVAVKILRPSLRSDRHDDEGLRREGMSASRVRHDGAVSVYDAGRTADGLAYLVMELLEGETLGAEMKRRGRLDLGRCRDVFVPVCEVLEAAHGAGVVHRDVKPDNVFLHRTADGGETVKVLDFGIAKWLWCESDVEATLRQTGSLLVGTLSYMAPERILGRDIDGRYDVYSLSAMLYEALGGQLPLPDQGNVISRIGAICQARPQDLRGLAPAVPKEVAHVVHRGLSKDPDRRPTPRQIADALRHHAGSFGTGDTVVETTSNLQVQVA